MRLPFPERVSLLPVLTGTLLLVMIQQLQGTTFLFSAGTAVFIVLAALAFNVSGGLTRPSGSFIFSYTCIAVIFGIVYKVVVGEPAHTNLMQPELTIELYDATIAAMLAAAYLAQRFRLKRSYLPQFASLEEMYRGSVGLVILGTVVSFMGFFVGTGNPGSFLAILNRLNFFLQLGIILGVTYEIRRSQGRRSVNGVVLTAIVISFISGVLSYSKQGMLTPFACWLIPAAAQRFRVSILQISVLTIAFGITNYYLVPYSQYGRNFKGNGGSLQGELRNNFLLLSNLELVRSIYMRDQRELFTEDDVARYYNKPQGLADRLEMLTPDDAVINLTEEGSVFGIYPTLFSFENLIPHFIWPGKPSIGFGNIYAHELGLIGDEEDNTTGISFSPTGDAFHQAKWVGILVLLPLLCLMLFFVVDSVCGDTRGSPFSLLLVLFYLHAAPEGGIVQFADLTFNTTAQIFIVAFVSARVMPLLASVLLGPAKEPMLWNPSTPKSARLPPDLQAAVETAAE